MRIQSQTRPFHGRLELLQNAGAHPQHVLRMLIARLKEILPVDSMLATEVMGFARDPFSVARAGCISTRAKEDVLSIDEGKFILGTLSNPQLRHESFIQRRFMKFWSDANKHQFPNVHGVAIHALSVFGLTYTCQSRFSQMNSIKCSTCCSLTGGTLHQCL